MTESFPPTYVRSHGEALTFEPLLMEDREHSPLRDLYIVAIATVTQVNLSQLPFLYTHVRIY
jgi:hypothetical protein